MPPGEDMMIAIISNFWMKLYKKIYFTVFKIDERQVGNS